ncbi:MAG: hypothetical protein KKC19_04355 [Nanoarchaeota archaeon]|nr:hypothetical protein [Nanoarchaeota archaeon]
MQDEEDINPCNWDYWNNRLVKNTIGMLHYDLTNCYDSLSQKAKSNILEVHKHLRQCKKCNESLTTILKDIATDETIAEEAEVQQVPPEAFKRLKLNRKFLDSKIV